MGLKELIESREAVVGVIGLGYVGLPLAMAAAGAGFEVVGLEKDEDKRGKLERGEVLYEGLDGERLRKLISEGHFKVTGELKDIYPCHVICVCVPTPLSRTREPDLRFVREASEQVAVALQGGECPKLIILESALLFEAGWLDLVDQVWVTIVPQNVSLERTKKQRGVSEEDLLARLSAQMPGEEKARQADVAIDTDCSLEELRLRVAELWRSLKLEDSP